MSPEQASGDGALDGRSDIYSLGCVLYEMLSGQPPFSGPNAQAVAAKHLTQAPPPLHDLLSVSMRAANAALGHYTSGLLTSSAFRSMNWRRRVRGAAAAGS